MTSSTNPIRVVFVDDNVLAARALERWMESTPRLRFGGWAGDAETAARMLARESPEVVLLDLEMPGVDTLALIPLLRAACPSARVVVFSGFLRPVDIGRALDAGAAGYIGKDEPTAVVTSLVLRAAAGECVLSPLVQRSYLGGQ